MANQGRKPNTGPMNGMNMSGGAPAMPPSSMIPPSMVPPGRTRLVPSRSGFTLAQLESIALTANPTLIQAQAQVEASLSKSLQAGLMPNPVMGYVGEQIGAFGGPGHGPDLPGRDDPAGPRGVSTHLRRPTASACAPWAAVVLSQHLLRA